MYPAHFGLQKRLFDEGIAAETALFRGGQHDTLIAHFKLALDSATSVIVLRGPAGVGKSTLTSAALRASSTRLALAWINGTPVSGAELLELLLVELGVNAPRASRVERLQLWRQFQAEMSATESRLFVVVERTEDMPVEVLHALDSLTAADAAGHPGANVVLLGHQGVDAHLCAPVLDSFQQRIRLRAELKPFSEAELQDYLRHRVASAGGHYDRLFAPGTVAALHRYAGGVARLANNLCETALTLAASRARRELTAELVTEAAVTLLGLPAAAAPRPAPAQIVAAPRAAPSVPAVAPPFSVPAAQAPTPAASPLPAVAPPSALRRETVEPSASASPERPRLRVEPAPRPPASAAAPTPSRPAPPLSAAKEFDGAATDVPDVEIDFPVLTDAVEPDNVGALPKRAAPAAQPPPALAAAPPVAASPVPPAVAPVVPLAPLAAAVPPAASVAAAAPPAAPAAAAAAPAAARSASAAKLRSAPTAQPAAAAPKTVALPTGKPPPAAAAAPPPAEAPSGPAADEADDDLLHQTQTMRALALAKSIDDVSDSMAETLFNDADLDLLTAALASAAGWSENEAETPPPAGEAPKAAAKPSATPAPKPVPPAPEDDLLGLLGLSEDAPLELLEDSAEGLPPPDQGRKTAQR